MVDQAVDIREMAIPEVREENRLETAASELARRLKGNLERELSEKGELSLDEIFSRVLKYEDEYGERVTEDEFEALTILSLVLGTVKTVYEKKLGKRFVPKDALIISVQSQQDAVKTVLNNLDSDGKPNRGIMKIFGLTTEIFEEYFDPEKSRIKEVGVDTEAGLWQGIQGMVTTALLFNESGWEVKLPPPQLDIDYEMDLLARNQEGQTYAVDVTAKRPRIIDQKGNLSESFFVEKKSIPHYLPDEVVGDLSGFIRINVPPLNHHSSHSFYEDRMSGYPSKEAVAEFMDYLEV